MEQHSRPLEACKDGHKFAGKAPFEAACHNPAQFCDPNPFVVVVFPAFCAGTELYCWPSQMLHFGPALTDP